MKLLKTFNQLFETKKISIKTTRLSKDLTDRLINDFSFIVWKGKKRNGTKNYKSIRLIEIDGYYNKNVNFNSSDFDILLKLTFTNNDYIEAKYNKTTNIEQIVDNTITISINQRVIFDLDNEKYTEDFFIEKIKNIYINYLKKKHWKIK